MIGRKEKTEVSHKAVRNALIFLASVFLLGLGLRYHQAKTVESPVIATFIINSGTIAAEIADTPEKKELGLGERDALERRHGMYFPFSSERKWLFWMKGMRFPIDAVWVRDGMVVDVTRSAQPPRGEGIERFSPGEPADGVLEINAGEVDELHIKKGDILHIQY